MYSASVQEKSALSATTEAVEGRSSASKPNGSALSGNSAPSGPSELELVDRADGQFGDEDLPQAAVEALAHLAAPSVPLIEVADDGHARRVGRPDGEQHAVDALVVDELGAEPAVELAMGAFAQQDSRRAGPAPARTRRGRCRNRFRARSRLRRDRPAAPWPTGSAPRKSRPCGAATRPGARRRGSARAPRSRSGANTRMTHPAAVWCGPSTAKGSDLRAAAMASSASSGALHSSPIRSSLATVWPIGQLIGANGAFQISFAYSAIVRSDENQPTLAVLRMLERIQRLRSRQASSIFICVAQ